MFNTLKYAKMLQEVGFSKDQAERSVEILLEIMENKLATKSDLQVLQSEFKSDITNLESRLTVRMTLMTASSVTLTVTLITLFNKFL